jgi:hypothetical protein
VRPLRADGQLHDVRRISLIIKLLIMQIIGGQFMRNIAKRIQSKLPSGFGFCLIVFPFNKPGIANYISNAKRETMIEALEEKIKVLKSKGDFQTPDEN